MNPIFGTLSKGIANIPLLDSYGFSDVRRLFVWRKPDCDVTLAWGRRKTANKTVKYAERYKLGVIYLEDGMIRSYGIGLHFPPLSLVIDPLNIYYDNSSESMLESLLNSDENLLGDDEGFHQSARHFLLNNRLSKYNHAPLFEDGSMAHDDIRRVLVIDQTLGDMSVNLSGANESTFSLMLETARLENPGATIYVKTHPDVSTGRKSGYLDKLRNDDKTVVLRAPVNPQSLIEKMDQVYVVSSTMGFEALLANKPVTCFGMPWYAGWGVTDDRSECLRRTRKRTVDELFNAAYIRYARYIDPETHKIGSIFDVMHWLVRQREVMRRLHGESVQGRLLCFGFRGWKAVNLSRLLTLDQDKLYWVKSLNRWRNLKPTSNDSLVFWGDSPPAGVAELARETDTSLVRLEDGFIRSVGLGSDFIPPRSLVLDRRGIYFDPSQPSDLEVILNEACFTCDELTEARQVREFMVKHGITKYNLDKRGEPSWKKLGRRVVFVAGQVEDDASIRLGAGRVSTNLGLLEAARQMCPGDFIVYKPHPDVVSGNRHGRVSLNEALRWADYVETECSVVSCVDVCDEVHTMTSLTGFDALLRGKKVVVYGQPFYAGWGLTHDILQPDEAVAFQRRKRTLSLDQLVAGTMLRYPIYWDPVLKGYTSCMAVLRALLQERTGLEANGGLEKLRRGWFRRKGRKASIQLRAWLVGYK